MLKWCQNGNQSLIQNEKWNEKDMQQNNAETECSERRPKTCKGKEKEVTGRKSEAGGNFGPRRTEWEEAYLPLKGGTLRPGPPRRKSRTGIVYSDSLRILGHNFGAHGPNPAARGLVHFGPLVAPVRFKRIGS